MTYWPFSKASVKLCHFNCVAHNTAESCSKTLANTHLMFPSARHHWCIQLLQTPALILHC